MSERVERIRELWGAVEPSQHRAPQLIRDVQTLLAALDAVQAKHSDTEGWLASLADRVNTWLREIHRDHAQTTEWTPQAIGRAVDEIGYAHNQMQQQRDAALSELSYGRGRDDDDDTR